MNATEIAAAKVRAEDVLNGFTRGVIAQHARDVVKLAEALQAANRKLEGLQREKPIRGDQADDFGSVFDALMKGKKP